MKLTFVYMTIRAGGLDLLTACLREQTDPGDWELIVVDGFPGRVERGEAECWMASNGLPLKAYVAPKPKTFPWSRTGFANAINTGALHASGEFVVYLHDYTVYPPDMVKLWRAVLSNTDGRTLVHGVGQDLLAPEPDALSDVQTWINQPGFRYRGDWVPEVFELGYFAVPVRYFEEGNGVDERADFCFCYATRAVVAQARRLGYALRVEKGLVCGMIDHHVWEKEVDRKKFHVKSHWRIPGEFSDVPEEPRWTGWAANPYNMAAERAKIASESDRPVRVHPKYHFNREIMEIK